MPRISVIIPTYNRSQLVVEAIDSVLNQTFRDFELIVINDGSTDDTEEKVTSIEDSRIKYIKQPNGGVSSARNRGIDASNGELIAFLDSDDLYLPEKLKVQVEKFELSPSAGLVYGLYYGTTVTRTELSVAGICYDPLKLDQLILGPVFHWSTVALQHSWLDRVGKFDEQFQVGEEWELTLRLAIAGCTMVCIPQPLTIKRSPEVSLSRDLYKYQMSSSGVLDKTFCNPSLPAGIQDLRQTAYASQLIMTASSAYMAGEFDQGKQYLGRAVSIDPTLLDNRADVLMDKFISYISGLSLDDPRNTIRNALENLPNELNHKNGFRKELWGNYYARTAFKDYQLGMSMKCIIDALMAMAYYPANVRNKGLLSIVVQSFIGEKLFHRVKSLIRLH